MRSRGFAADPSESLCLVEIEVEAEIEIIRLRRFHRHPSTAKAVPLPSKEGRLGCFRGAAADEPLTTLHIKRANASAAGPFLGKGLPNELGLADGNGWKRRRLTSFPGS